MIELHGQISMAFLKKSRFTGSYQGMRYKMEKAQIGEGEEAKTVLRVVQWPEPYSFDATKDEKKTSMDTSFDEEGIEKGIDWLNEEYLKHYQPF